MERYADLDKISDGKKYTANDMVKVECNDCAGCHACCQHMEGLITLDPYDIFRMTKVESVEVGEQAEDKQKAMSIPTEGMTFGELTANYVELQVDRGIIIPILKMSEQTGNCVFLNAWGRCKIHKVRPGICRLFPLGRVYEEESFYYFLQKYECEYENKTKVKVKKWLDTPDLTQYEKYISDWHYFMKELQDGFESLTDEDAKSLNMLLLQMFYFTPYEDFYREFYDRLHKVKSILQNL